MNKRRRFKVKRRRADRKWWLERATYPLWQATKKDDADLWRHMREMYHKCSRGETTYTR